MPDLTLTQLATELQVSTSKLARLTRAGRIPCLRIGRAVRYELEPVKAALRVPVLSRGQGPRAKAHEARRTDHGASAGGTMPVWAVAERARIHAENRAARRDKEAG